MQTRRSLLAGLAATPILAGAAPSPVTVIEARKIVTMEPSRPFARFAAIADGMILGLADSEAELAIWTRGRTVSRDRRFAGRILYPGLIDPHVHPMQAAIMLNLPFVAPEDWDLPSGHWRGALTAAAYHARLAEELAKAPPGPFICWGHHELFHGPLDRNQLDRLAPNRPVIIWQRSFHEVIVNSATLAAWNMASAEEAMAAIKAKGAEASHMDYPRGIFSETALAVALEKMRPVLLGPGKIEAGMADLRRMLVSRGVTTISDMATGIFASFEAEAGLIRAAFERSDAAARVMLMPTASMLDGVPDVSVWLATSAARFAGSHVLLNRRVKLLADGAFFALNMRMNPPGYLDGHLGKWITPPAQLAIQIPRYWALGLSLHIHVNGDEGLDVVLAAIEKLPPRRDATITLEHLGYSTEAQNRRIARAGLMVSAQPNYIRVLGDAYARAGLGPDRAAVMNRLGSLERKNVVLGLHSDFNMAPIDPLYLAWIAANRITLGGLVKAPAERISPAKALRAITIDAAQVIGLDAMVGSIAAGKRADFAVLDRDPEAGGAVGLRDAKVAGVIYEGRFTAA